MNIPLVAVFMVTYNHESYIEQSIESVLMQKTSFPIKLFIGEDCSTDKTDAICLKYQGENPEVIEVILNKRNIGATNNAIQIFNRCFSSGAKYIAMLEGDDYWTDPDKLQKQVDFLEANPEYSICFHKVMILKNGEMLKDYLTPEVPEETEILELAKGNFILTPSVVFRNKLFENFPEQFSRAPVGDYFLHMLNARYGKIKKINQVMAVYRVHDEGIHSKKTQTQKDDEWLTQLSLMIPCFEGDTKSILSNMFLQFAKSVLLNNKKISIERQSLILKKISEQSPGFLIRLIEENEELKQQLNLRKNEKRTLMKLLKRMFAK